MVEENVSSQTPFGFVTTYRGATEAFEGSIPLHTSGGVTYVSREDVTRNPQWIDKYKLVFSKATFEHAGTPDKSGKYRVFSGLRMLKPEEICTQSYLIGSTFDTEEETQNCISYFKTKFVRFLIIQLVTSQDMSADRFHFVPIHDYSEPWTDEKLYAKYGITPDEQAYIETLIKPME